MSKSSESDQAEKRDQAYYSAHYSEHIRAACAQWFSPVEDEALLRAVEELANQTPLGVPTCALGWSALVAGLVGAFSEGDKAAIETLALDLARAGRGVRLFVLYALRNGWIEGYTRALGDTARGQVKFRLEKVEAAASEPEVLN